MSVRPAKTHEISLGICTVWSESSLCAQWVAKDPSFPYTDIEDSDQTGRIPRLIRVFAGRKLILLVLSCRGSFKRRTKSLSTVDFRKILKLSSSNRINFLILLIASFVLEIKMFTLPLRWMNQSVSFIFFKKSFLRSCDSVSDRILDFYTNG